MMIPGITTPKIHHVSKMDVVDALTVVIVLLTAYAVISQLLA